MIPLSRRSFLAVVALTALAKRWVAFGQSVAANGAPISVDEFRRLSEALTGRAQLDRELATIYRDALVATPANLPLLAHLAAGKARGPEHAALEATILEWWYTGMYAVDGQPRVATHEGALMWSVLGVMAPGMCAGAFGAWAQPAAAAP